MEPDSLCIRHVDELGRIVIPAEFRRRYGMEAGSPVAILPEGDGIRLRLHRDSCAFCGSTEHLAHYRGQAVCHDCLIILHNKVSTSLQK